MRRIVRQPFTLSDGTHLPKGIAAPVYAIHLAESNYPDPASFVPFRFADNGTDTDIVTAKKEGAGRKVDMTATSTDFLPFGHGRHACPGRFFVAAELKLMLALIVMKYDVKLEGPHPEPVWVMTSCLPNPKGEVLFRKRAAARD
jgi:cytochrome P450